MDDLIMPLSFKRSRADFLGSSGSEAGNFSGSFSPSQVARRLNALLGERNQEQLIRTLATLESATVSITALAQAIEPGMKGLPALTVDARKTLQHANVLMGNLDNLGRQLAQRLDTLERMAKSAEQVAGSAKSVTGAVEEDVMPRINALLGELARSSRSLDRLLTELNDQPHSLVFGRPAAAPGPGEPGFNLQPGSSQK
jgi:phospholipid/cholesterol/gamma-HCH transport system substrate-binding protein